MVTARAEIIRSTYQASLVKLLDAVATFDEVFCLDSSHHGEPPFQAAIARRGKLTILDAATPEWLAAVGFTPNH